MGLRIMKRLSVGWSARSFFSNIKSKIKTMEHLILQKLVIMCSFVGCLFFVVSVYAANPPVADLEYMPFYTDNYTKSTYSYNLALLSAAVAAESYNSLGSNSACVSSGPINSMYNCALTEAGFKDVSLVKDNSVSLKDDIAIQIAKDSVLGNVTPVVMLSLAKLSMQAVVGYKYITVSGKSRRVVAVSFRGTEFGNPAQRAADLAIDGSAGSVMYASNDVGNKVHEGFFASEKVMESLEHSTVLNGMTLDALIANSATAGDSGDIFWISGHSLGGAIATLYAAR